MHDRNDAGVGDDATLLHTIEEGVESRRFARRSCRFGDGVRAHAAVVQERRGTRARPLLSRQGDFERAPRCRDPARQVA
jgi:hypothetical protein